MQNRKTGFTLVELSIVLVIIGLLIGGILVAQSMIQTAKITAQVKQFQQFDIAVTNFKTKFGALPGDSATIPPATGNVNGIIDTCEYGGGQEYYYTGCEFSNFWPELTATQMLMSSQQYSVSIVNNTWSPGYNVPYSIIEPKMGIMAYGIEPTGSYTGNNYYSIFGPNRSNYPYQGSTPSAVEALALDTKMDDGNPNTGNIVAANIDLLEDYSLASGWFGLGCTSGTAYAVSTSGASCRLNIVMLSQVGQNQ